MIVNCDYCGKEINKKADQVRRYKRHFCNKKCYDLLQKGIKNKNNEYIIKDDYAIIVLNSKVYGVNNVLIDLDDIEKCKRFCWYALPSSTCNGYYILAKDIHNLCNAKNIRLHRYIMNCPDNMVVDHINHNTLDNRKKNLRICTIKENNFNRRTPSNNTSGHKNIHKNKDFYRVNVNNVYIGIFKKLEDAIIARDLFYKENNLKLCI